MATANQDILAILAAIQAGELDSLTPEQIAQAEAFLNATPGAGAVLADQIATPELRLQAAPAPPPAAWERVWNAIDSAGAVAESPTAILQLRFWRPLLAAAAVLAILVGFWSLQRATAKPEWPVAWATHIEIDDLEVSDDATPLVLSADGEDTIPVIWVLEGGS